MRHTCSSDEYLQPGKELVCILVLPEVQALAVIVFESIPERTGDVVILISQCQVCKHILHNQQFYMSAQSFLQQVQVQVCRGSCRQSALRFTFALPLALGRLVTLSCRCQARHLYAGQEVKACQQQPISKKATLVLAKLETLCLPAFERRRSLSDHQKTQVLTAASCVWRAA